MIKIEIFIFYRYFIFFSRATTLKAQINHLKTIKIKIWAKMVPKSKSR